MTSAPEHLDLAAEFPAASRDQWRELVAAVLAKSGREPEGAPEQALTTTTDDGIVVQPLYTSEDTAPPAGVPGVPPYVRGATPGGAVAAGWDVRAGYTDTDAAAVNEAALADLEHGVGSLWLAVGKHGVPVGDLARALDEVLLDLAPVAVSPGSDWRAAADALLAVYADRGIPDSEVRASLGIDPLADGAAEYVAGLAGRYPKVRAVTVDASRYHETGGSDAQQLGFGLADGVAALRALTGAGLSAADAAAQLEFRYAATVDQFGTIATLRAARRLWARVCEVAEIPDTAQYQHAVSSAAMMTVRDPWVNMLRTTVAAFAAGVGGADAVTVRPFDARIGVADPFARRIARNTQAILLEESHLAGVIDPAGGSYYVERLTDELARAAWALFKEVEGSAVAADTVAARIEEVRSRRATDIAHRRRPITGVTEFPNLDEKPLRRKAAPQPGELHYAAEFEQLRDRSDRAARRPTVFLATLGTLAQYTARAGFARNLYAAGGIATVDAGPTESVDDVVAAAKDHDVVCVCGTEKAYDEWLGELLGKLREAGARFVAIAGKPRDGVDSALYTGCDALAVLRETLEVAE